MLKIAGFAAIASAALVSTQANAEAFSGPYIGADVSYDRGELSNSYEWHEDNGDLYEDKENGRSLDGISGGIFVGYDTPLSGKFFGGVELRASLSSAKYKNHSHIVWQASDLDRHADLTIRQRQSYSATARVGYKINDNTGLYLRGGIAETTFKAKNQPGFPVSFDPQSDEYSYRSTAKDSNTGWVYGAGLESSVSENVTMRIEYNITDYGSAFNKLNNALSAAEALQYNDDTRFSTKLNVHQVRLGVAFRF